MEDCCCPPPESQNRHACARCGGRTSAVEIATVKAILTSAALARLESDAFRFCPNPVCEAVYVSSAGKIFDVADVRVPVWQKLPAGDRTICYCFGEGEREIEDEVRQHGRSLAFERVRSHVTERRCACEIRNPRGTCCLTDIRATVARLQASQEVER